MGTTNHVPFADDELGPLNFLSSKDRDFVAKLASELRAIGVLDSPVEEKQQTLDEIVEMSSAAGAVAQNESDYTPHMYAQDLVEELSHDAANKEEGQNPFLEV